jgi:hypothetical protein
MFDYDVAIARVPRWIVILGLLGTGIAGRLGGTPYAGSFFLGSIAAWINYKLLERGVNKLDIRVSPRPRARGVRMFIRFALFVLGAFAILKVSGLNVVVALCGLLVCPAAVLVEIFYELLTYGHS